MDKLKLWRQVRDYINKNLNNIDERILSAVFKVLNSANPIELTGPASQSIEFDKFDWVGPPRVNPVYPYKPSTPETWVTMMPMEPIPICPSNSFIHNQMGYRVGKNLKIMFDNFDSQVCEYLVLVHTITGQRVKLIFK